MNNRIKLMKHALFLVAALSAGTVLAADPSAGDAVKDAIAKLKSSTNYSWTMTLKMPGEPFEPGPLKGRTEKDGYAVISQEMGDNTLDAVFKGNKVALKIEGEWRVPDASDGMSMMMAGWITRYGTAADEAESTRLKAKELKAGEAGAFSADLTDQGAKESLTFSGPNQGTNGPPPPKNAKGSVKYWVKDGILTKFESHLQGKITMGPDQDEQDFDMTRTFEIKDIGSTKLDAPAEALKKLQGK
jgi:hypothetical protein